jgi:hypothetical protein
MARFVELRRHTDNDGDVLTGEGVAAALRIGAGLAGGYQLGVSTGAQRATQTLACLLAALAQPVPGGVVVEPGLRSGREDDWRAAYQRAGSGELAALRAADPELVLEDSARLGAALGRVLERLSHGARALAVGHSPTNEAAVFGLTARWSRRWPREPASCWSPTVTASGSSPWTPDARRFPAAARVAGGGLKDDCRQSGSQPRHAIRAGAVAVGQVRPDRRHRGTRGRQRRRSGRPRLA